MVQCSPSASTYRNDVPSGGGQGDGDQSMYSVLPSVVDLRGRAENEIERLEGKKRGQKDKRGEKVRQKRGANVPDKSQDRP